MEINKPLEIREIKNLLTKKKEILFLLKEGTFSRKYIRSIQIELPNYLVNEIKWLNKLIIVPSISTKTVLDNLSEFYYCIELFDKTAHHLMKIMAETFDINLSNSDEIYDLKMNRSEKQRGKINSEWRYHFHGKGCSFINIKTEQFLDVQIINGLEYGELDNYFLMKFIQTTKSLKKMSLIINNQSKNLRKVIEVLWNNDYLIELPNGTNNELIINRNKKPPANKSHN